MRKPLAIAVLTLLGTTAFAAGEVYRWKDANGTWNYSDQPRPGAELVKGGKATSDPNSAPAAQAPAAPPAPATTTPMPVSKEVADQVRQEAASAKAEQCEKAKVEYDKYVRAQAIYKTDAKGNRIDMSPAEMDAARLQARANRDLACGP